ncbi:hypothetical protein QMA04_01310 [Planococcus sp. APC 3900]|uniref:hypothetical protein n=1 Tax=Planococcus sp. APC 3900 TaxID=3035191 RepID=UPI0025B5065E|nr:hypothetical protein [Planococcus sp. APC 3900]MDN3436704.1 hypothetical protein [Planococcus sp. APC 3900]
MWPTIFTIVTLIVFGFSIKKIIAKRKEAFITGWKSLGTSICFFLIAAINLLAYWFDFSGIISLFLTILLLAAGAYFTRYLPDERKWNNAKL